LPYLFGKNAPSGDNRRSHLAAFGRVVARSLMAGLVLLGLAVPTNFTTPVQAAGETRTLKLYFVHTGEKAMITFKRNGRFDPKGLNELNRFLRDWRRNQPTKMDPRLFDLVWEVYQRTGSKEYINVVSAFRSPETNGMLRSRTKGVAKSSQHMLGKAMDFFIPGVKLATIRQLGMSMQVGGVGFYPTSGSPFVHLDVGSVRAWPRMSRDELVKVFPNGKTIHIPADGKPLPGYEQAMADYKRRVSSSSIEIASSAGAGSSTKKRGFLATLFGGGGDEDEDSEAISAPATAASRPQPAAPKQQEEEEVPAVVAPAAPPVLTASAEPTPNTVIAAPVPLSRPAFREQPAGNLATALYSPPPSSSAAEALVAALPTQQPEAQGEGFADLQAYKIPVPTLLGKRPLKGDAEVLTASADSSALQALSAAELAVVPVPVPVTRPAVAEALLAKTEDADEVDDEADQSALSPSVVAALSQRGDDVRAAINQAAMTQPMAASFPTPAGKPAPAPVQVAALTPKPAPANPASTKPSSDKPRVVDFGDAFVAPKAANAGIEAGLPAKGSRPKKEDADTARMAMVGGEAPLTQAMIAQWASKGRFENMTKAVKAPRFVSRTMNVEPSAVYSVGFQPVTKSVDPGRFSGTAPAQ
jgi:uncharacterized protein YcbK (DUF882 family)